MASAFHYDELCWYVVHTKPQQEERADSNLRVWNIETFAPKIRERQYNKYTGNTTYVTKPLFQGYIFVRFRVSELWRKVTFTRGVHSIVCTGGSPGQVEDEIIEMIKSQRGPDGFVNMNRVLRPGDKVVITEGPLRHLMGIFEGRYKDEERVSILLTAVKYQSRVLIGREAIRKAS